MRVKARVEVGAEAYKCSKGAWENQHRAPGAGPVSPGGRTLPCGAIKERGGRTKQVHSGSCGVRRVINGARRRTKKGDGRPRERGSVWKYYEKPGAVRCRRTKPAYDRGAKT